MEQCGAEWTRGAEWSERAKRGGNGGGGGKSLRRRWLVAGEGGWYLAKRGRSWVAVFSTAAFRSPISLRNSLALFLFFSHFFLDSSLDTAYSLLLIVHLSAYPSYQLLSPSSDSLTLPILSSFLSSILPSILPFDGEYRPLPPLTLSLLLWRGAAISFQSVHRRCPRYRQCLYTRDEMCLRRTECACWMTNEWHLRKTEAPPTRLAIVDCANSSRVPCSVSASSRRMHPFVTWKFDLFGISCSLWTVQLIYRRTNR